MAIIQTGDLNHQHFSASAGDTVVFTRPIVNVIIDVPTGATVTVDFDGSAALAGASPLDLAVGTHQFINILVKKIVVAGSGSITGVGVCT
jgi:predicted RecA/RadA family phage recombinase